MVDVGFVVENGGVSNLKKWKAVSIREPAFHQFMKAVITGHSTDARLVPTQLITGLATGSQTQNFALELPFYFADPAFDLMKNTGLQTDISGGSGGSDETAVLHLHLAAAKTVYEAIGYVPEAVVAKAVRNLLTVVQNIDVNKSMHAYWVDSLVAAEIRLSILRGMKADENSFDVLSGVSREGLSGKIVAASKLVLAGLA